MEIKFDVYFKKNLGTLFKSNEVDLDGILAHTNLDLKSVDRLEVNYKVGTQKYTDSVGMVDIEERVIQIPFKSDVVKVGLNEFEIVAYMLNGDIKTSQTYTYNIDEAIGEGIVSGSGDGHFHANLTILNSITQTKINEWNNKANKEHTHSDYAEKNHTHNANEIEGLDNIDIDLSNYYTKNETYNKTEIDSKITNMGAGGSVDLSNYYTKSETDEAMNDKANKVHTHSEYLTEHQDISHKADKEHTHNINEIQGLGNIDISLSVEPNEFDVPKVFFTSDTMLNLNNKSDGEVVAEFEYISKTLKFKSYVEVKVQGSSSTAYPKKNYTIKLYKDSGKSKKEYINLKNWGNQTKFCLKANYVDTTHTRNIAGARIAYDMVESRPVNDFKTSLQTAPRNGLIDGFPIKVFINGDFHGIYTWNIPKDEWQFNNPKMVLSAETNNNGNVNISTPCQFRALWSGNDGDAWSVEAGTLTDGLKSSFNRCIDFVINSSDADFKKNIENYFDLHSLLDYYCFSYFCCHLDGLGRNMLMVTYDGNIWGASLYDMDSIFGAYYNGSSFVSTTYKCPEQYQENNSLLWQRLENCFSKELYLRYKELRKSALSLGNIISHVENIYDLLSDRDLLEEKSKWTALPSAGTNTISRFRKYMKERAAYVDNEFELLNADPILVAKITLNKEETKVNVGSSDTLIVSYEPNNATERGILWESSDTSIATVNNGVVSGVSNGICNITATLTSNSNVKATCTVTVQTEIIPVRGISVNKPSSILTIGETEQLISTIIPSNATNQSVIWSSSDSNIATVSNEGLVEAKSTGNVVITATTAEGNYKADVVFKIEGKSNIDEKFGVNLDDYELYTFDGTENWNTSNGGNAEYACFELVGGISLDNRVPVNETWFSNSPLLGILSEDVGYSCSVPTLRSSSYGEGITTIKQNNSQISVLVKLKISRIGGNTVALFKSYLSQNKLNVYLLKSTSKMYLSINNTTTLNIPSWANASQYGCYHFEVKNTYNIDLPSVNSFNYQCIGEITNENRSVSKAISYSTQHNYLYFSIPSLELNSFTKDGVVEYLTRNPIVINYLKPTI